VIPGLNGNVVKFRTVAYYLRDDQPVFALLPRGCDEQKPPASRYAIPQEPGSASFR
jgi:hypothetical protein